MLPCCAELLALPCNVLICRASSTCCATLLRKPCSWLLVAVALHCRNPAAYSDSRTSL